MLAESLACLECNSLKSVWTVDGICLVCKSQRDLRYTSIIFGMDGNQHTARFNDFISLQESYCGFGDTQREAVDDLLGQWAV